MSTSSDPPSFSSQPRVTAGPWLAGGNESAVRSSSVETRARKIVPPVICLLLWATIACPAWGFSTDPETTIGYGRLHGADMDPSCRLLMTLSDASLHLWFLNGTLASSFTSPEGLSLSCAEWSPDGSMIAVADCMGQLQVLRAPALTLVRSWRSPHQCNACRFSSTPAARTIAWSHDGRKVAHSWPDGILCVYDLETGEHKPTDVGAIAGEEFSLAGIDLSQDDLVLLSWNSHNVTILGKMLVLNATDEGILLVLEGGMGTYSPGGSMIAGTLTYWRFGLSFPPGIDTGQMLPALIETRYSAVVYDASSGNPLSRMNTSSAITSIAWSPDWSRLAVATQAGSLLLLDPLTGEALSNKTLTSPLLTLSWREGLLASTSSDNRAALWAMDPESGTFREARALSGWGSSLIGLEWYPESEHILITPGECGPLSVYSTNGSLRHQIGDQGHCHNLSSAVSPDGRMVASSTDGWSVEIRDARYGALANIIWLCARAEELQWSPRDPEILAIRYGDGLELWDVASGRIESSLSLIEATAMAWSPDGERIATGTSTGIEIWDPWSPRIISMTPTLDGVISLAWSPNGAMIMSTTGRKREYEETECGSRHYAYAMAGEVTIWTADEGGLAKLYSISYSGNYEDGEFLPNDCAWSGNSTMIGLATGSLTHSISTSTGGPLLTRSPSQSGIEIWLVEHGMVRLSTLTGPVGPVHSLTWSPDSLRIAAISDDGITRIWKVGEPQPIDEKHHYLAALLLFPHIGLVLHNNQTTHNQRTRRNPRG